MKKKLNLNDCIKNKMLIETGISDKDMAMEILKLAKHRENFWNEVNLDNKYPTLYIEGYYEIIKELSIGILSIDGWKTLNHECMFIMLKNQKDLNIDFNFIMNLKRVRNDIDYRGAMLSNDIWINNKLRIKLTIDQLKEYLQNKIGC